MLTQLMLSEIRAATTPQSPWDAKLRYNPYWRQIGGKHLCPTPCLALKATTELECGSPGGGEQGVDNPLDLWGGDQGQRVLCHPAPQVLPSHLPKLSRCFRWNRMCAAVNWPCESSPGLSCTECMQSSSLQSMYITSILAHIWSVAVHRTHYEVCHEKLTFCL